jgi:hypothetical protein
MTLPVSVAVRPRPFGPVHRRHLRAGERLPTIAEIFAATPGLPPGFAQTCEACVNDIPVPRSMWHLVRPLSSHHQAVAVTFTQRLQNGGGSSAASAGSSGAAHKNPLATVASIAVLLVGAAVSGGALAALAPGLLGAFGAGTIAASVAGAAVGIGGALAIAALTPPPSLGSQQQGAAAANPADAAAQLPASLSGNVLAPGAPLPRVIGTMRLFPPLLCQPLVDLVGDNEYAEMVMGLEGPHALSVPRAGDVNLSDIVEAVTELQDGLPNSPKQTLCPRYGFTLEPATELVGHIVNTTSQQQLDSQSDPDSSSPQWFSFVSKKAGAGEIWLTLAWPEGLSKEDDAASTYNQAVRLRFRKRGDVTWVNCPEIHFSSNSPSAFAKTIRFKWATIPAAPTLPPANKGPVYAYADVPGQTGLTPTTTGWNADSYFGSAGSGTTLLQQSNVATTAVLNTELGQDRVTFYLASATYPQTAPYEIQVMRSAVYKSTNFTASTYVTVSVGGFFGNVVYDYFKYSNQSGVYIIPLDKSKTRERVILTRLATVFNTNPVQTDGVATVSVKVHSRALGQISVLASGYTKDWDGSGFNTVTTTSNPAPHYYEILTGTLGARPLTTDIVDSAGLVTWRTYCNTQSLTANAVLEGRSYAEALTLIAAAGYARPWQSEKAGVLVDKSRVADTPVQKFSPRNLRNFKWEKAFADKVTGFRVSYRDSANDYRDTEIIVYDDPANPDSNNLESIRNDAQVTSALVTARAQFDLEQVRRRLTFYTGEADVEAIVCQRGDLIGVQHDILTTRAGFARIVEVVKSGSNITGLKLDGSVPVDTETGLFSKAHLFTETALFAAGANTGIAIRLKNGAGALIKQITASVNDEVVDITFSTPFADPGTIDRDCLCNVGALGSEEKRLIVTAITYKNDLTATLTMVDEAPELFT